MTRPDWTAWSTCIRPDPMSNQSPAVTPSSFLTVGVAVIAKAERILSGDQLGLALFTNAAAPAT